MALSNWDTLAVDEKGNPSNGTFVSPAGVEVSIYKNWLYIRDPKAWRDAKAFTEPTVAEVQEGRVRYMDVHVHAKRGPQDGVYVVVSTGYGASYKAMVGCGVYGFTDGGEWVGAEPASVAFLKAEVVDPLELTLEFAKLPPLDLSKAVRGNQGDAFFADHFGDPGMEQKTAPGEAKPSVFMGLMSGEFGNT